MLETTTDMIPSPFKPVLRFCKDCKHYRPISIFGDVPGCSVENLVDLVSGEPCYTSCDMMRVTESSGCGPEGKLWEAKPSAPAARHSCVATDLSPERALAQHEAVLDEANEKQFKFFSESLANRYKEWIKTRRQKTHDTQ